ncbi:MULTISPECIES: hypothetical protein [unclassified Marinobacter]|uniref:hypothetical protein n=1 Tax=unclassified Marinobacter TaxID=83889 RepID=UPI0012690550|nr:MULTISPECIES: hypothetical protein [unclassified Marinobacter]QFS87597.1 hypothetical protein FIV08_12260 [Marinobacter sp. THAF197a]QFT51382.1 hypothetical protein FIU96_12175 [Marinobacter sp. THAF39]
MFLTLAVFLRKLFIRAATTHMNLNSKRIIKSSERVRVARIAVERLEQYEVIKRDEYAQRVQEAADLLNQN